MSKDTGLQIFSYKKNSSFCLTAFKPPTTYNITNATPPPRRAAWRPHRRACVHGDGVVDDSGHPSQERGEGGRLRARVPPPHRKQWNRRVGMPSPPPLTSMGVGRCWTLVSGHPQNSGVLDMRNSGEKLMHKNCTMDRLASSLPRKGLGEVAFTRSARRLDQGGDSSGAGGVVEPAQPLGVRGRTGQ